jgi:hypothetical protein
MKPAVVFALAFVVATAAASGAKVMLTKPTHSTKAETDSSKAAADSTKTDTAIVATGQPPAVDSTRAAAPAPDSAVQTGPSAKPELPIKPELPMKAVTGSTVAAGVAPSAMQQGGPVAPAAPRAANDTMAQASERRLAKVFTAMDVKQAAKVLEHMTDGDVEIILGYVGPRQAASIMSALPPERVATLSKLAMQGRR